jgi:hypothetical protein
VQHPILRKPLYLLSIPFATLPFAVALVRSFRTNYDLSLLWLAFAAFAGATAVMLLGKARTRPTRTILALSALAFLSATLCSILAGRVLGVTALSNLVMVSTLFGLSWAVSYLLDALSRSAG